MTHLSSERPSLAVRRCALVWCVTALAGYPQVAHAESVYFSQAICVNALGAIRPPTAQKPCGRDTPRFFNVHYNDVAFVPDAGKCQLLVARDGTANSGATNNGEAQVRTSVYYGYLSALVPAIYINGEGRAHPAATSTSTEVSADLGNDKRRAVGFALRNATLLTAIRNMRVRAKQAGCQTLIIHAIGFSRGSEGLIAAYRTLVAGYVDRQDSANLVFGYWSLIDPVNSVAKASGSSEIAYHDLARPPAQAGEAGAYRRLQPLHVTQVIKEMEHRIAFQPHVYTPIGATRLRFNRAGQLSRQGGVPQAVTTLAQVGTAAETNTFEIAWINGMHSAWWRADELSAFALAEMAYVFPVMCAERVIDCVAYKLNFHDYYAAPAAQGDGTILGRQQRNGPRTWTRLPRSLVGPRSMNVLSLQTTPCASSVCTADETSYTYAGTNGYDARRWLQAYVAPSNQGFWSMRPRSGDFENVLDIDRATARTTFAATRSAFLTFFAGMRCCRQRCTPVEVGNHVFPEAASTLYYLNQCAPCPTLHPLLDANVNGACQSANPAYTANSNVDDLACTGAFTGPW